MSKVFLQSLHKNIHLLIKAETLLSLGSKGHFPFPESTLPGSSRKMYSWNGKDLGTSLVNVLFWVLIWLQESLLCVGEGRSLDPLCGRHFEYTWVLENGGIKLIMRSFQRHSDDGELWCYRGWKTLTALLDLLRGTKSTQSQLSLWWRGGGKCWEQSKTHPPCFWC